MARAYNNLFELFNDWGVRYQSVFRPANTRPQIWVRNIVDGWECQIDGYNEPDMVRINGAEWTLEEMFVNFVYLDGSAFGKENEE